MHDRQRERVMLSRLALSLAVFAGLFLSANDPALPNQWGLARIQAPAAWDTTQGNGVIIAILDTGIDDHPDLAGKVVDRITYTGLPGDVNGHGTEMASIAAAVTNNGLGMSGAGYDATVLDVKVIADNGSGPPTAQALADGIRWAVDHGAKVINLSWGAYADMPVVDEAIDYAWLHGALTVAAAGNQASEIPMYPAAYPVALAVGATDSGDFLALFSNHGPWVDVNAPGVGIYEAEVDGGYAFGAGTSQATAIVSGVAALLFAQGKTVAQVRSCIEQGSDSVNGLLRVNALNAVACTTAGPVPTPTGTPIPTPTPTATPTCRPKKKC